MDSIKKAGQNGNSVVHASVIEDLARVRVEDFAVDLPHVVEDLARVRVEDGTVAELPRSVVKLEWAFLEDLIAILIVVVLALAIAFFT